MSLVTIEGVFMGVALDEQTFDGNKKVSVIFDIYQTQSPLKNKSVQVKADDLALLSKLQNDFEMGSPFKVNCVVNAYKNTAYYKFVNFA